MQLKKVMGLISSLLVILIIVALGVGFIQFTGLTIGNKGVETFKLTEDADPSTPERDVNIEILKGTFSPHDITVKNGEKITLHITAKEIDEKFQTHGFAIKEFGISEKINISETKTITFTPDKEGSFVYFCNVFCGEGHMGQAGVLTVV